MSFVDLENVMANYVNVFGSDPAMLNLIGAIILFFLLAFGIYLSIGVEAILVLLITGALVLVSVGLLPAWLATIIYLLFAFLFVSFVLRLMRK